MSAFTAPVLLSDLAFLDGALRRAVLRLGFSSDLSAFVAFADVFFFVSFTDSSFAAFAGAFRRVVLRLGVFFDVFLVVSDVSEATSGAAFAFGSVLLFLAGAFRRVVLTRLAFSFGSDASGCVFSDGDFRLGALRRRPRAGLSSSLSVSEGASSDVLAVRLGALRRRDLELFFSSDVSSASESVPASPSTFLSSSFPFSSVERFSPSALRRRPPRRPRRRRRFLGSPSSRSSELMASLSAFSSSESSFDFLFRRDLLSDFLALSAFFNSFSIAINGSSGASSMASVTSMANSGRMRVSSPTSSVNRPNRSSTSWRSLRFSLNI